MVSGWVCTVCTVTVGTTSSMHLLMKPVTDVVYSSMPSDKIRNIFQSVLTKQSCSLASASSVLSESLVLPGLVFACKQEL